MPFCTSTPGVRLRRLRRATHAAFRAKRGGGSACAVAAGLCAPALGGDTLGSVRVPASYCGVVGFKASFGAVSARGSVACGYSLDHIGPLTRSLRDLRAVMPAIKKLTVCVPIRAVSHGGRRSKTPVGWSRVTSKPQAGLAGVT